MPAPTLKKTVKHDTVRPFELSSGNPWRAIRYRFDPAEPWYNALEAAFLVLPSNRDDVRKDVLHDFEISVDLEAVETDGVAIEDVEIILLVRDNFAKKVVHLIREPLSSQVFTISIPRLELEKTSLAARIDFQIMLVAVKEIDSRKGRIRRGGRLAVHTVTVSAEKKGHAFNFTRTSAAEFVRRGLPGTTTFFVDAPRPLDLVEACDDVSAALTVLVHEDAWATLQEIRTGDRIGEAVGAMFLADIINAVLALASQCLTERPEPLDEGSIAKRLLSRLAEKSGDTLEELENQIRDPEGLLTLQATVQAALRTTASLHRVQLAEIGQI